MNSEPTRRQFVASSLASAAVVSLASSAAHGGDHKDIIGDPVAVTGAKLRIRPRYHRWHVDPGVEWTEANTQSATLDWSIPMSQAALILVDVWDHHYLLDTEARMETIIADKLLPLLTACRKTGLRVIHAPSVAQAVDHPNWVRLVNRDQLFAPSADWPPADFRSKSGRYRGYRRPDEAREPELVTLRAERQLHPLIQPAAGEPVVATGEELHRYCRQQGILFLFYAGFNTNACVLVNDYGTLAMGQRGYEILIVRDCTTGMESADTQSTLSQTQGAILFLEMFGRYSVASDEMIEGMNDPSA